MCKGYPSAREGLLVNARFLLAQFERLDAASGHKALKYLDTDFGKSLAKEVGGGAGWLAGRVVSFVAVQHARMPPVPCTGRLSLRAVFTRTCQPARTAHKLYRQ